MIPLSRERRHSDRRAQPRGGRRATDAAGLAPTVPSCPSCAGASSEVGESDGGWWFVCANCDRLWNERERPESDSALPETVSKPTDRARQARADW